MSFSTARLTAAIDGAVAATTHVQLHTGAPGSAGTDNVASQAARAALAFPAATNGETEESAVFTITGAEGPYTHVTGWNASSSGTYQWTAALSPQESFAGAGELEVTVTATASNA